MMQPAAPEPSSAESSADVQAGEVSSEQSRPASRTFLQRLFRNGRGSQELEPEEQPEPEPQTSSAITLTQEELDRRIQAETDRREAKRATQAQAERRRKLRDEDPWAFAEEERKAEQIAHLDQQNGEILGNIGATHDRFTVDPVVLALPQAERNRIMAIEGAGLGLEGRKLIVEEGLKALEKHWKAEGAKDAEDKLRRNPAFRKQVLNEFRRGMSEPEFIGSGAPSANDKNVSNLLRGQLGSRRSL
jgi:hypothetical protein